MEDLVLNPIAVSVGFGTLNLAVLGLMWRSLASQLTASTTRLQAHEDGCQPFRDDMIERVTRIEAKIE